MFAVCLVDCIFARLACMCPFIVASWLGGHLLICLVVMVGKVVRYPAWIAFARVESVGEKRDLCRKVMRSAMVGASITELREWWCRFLGSLGVAAWREW